MARPLLVAVLLPAFAVAQSTTRASVDSSGAEGNDASFISTISSDARFVVFLSVASNLVTGDTNGVQDVFVRDRLTGATECVSVDPSGIPGNGSSGNYYWNETIPSISADGRFVSFVSSATNLISGLTTSWSQLFVRDRATGVTEIVSVDSSGIEGNSDSANSSLSADGRILAFDSDATNLVAGDTNGNVDVFVHDRVTGVTERVSVTSSGKQSKWGAYSPSVSGDGFSVAFSSESFDLVPNDRNSKEDAFVHDRRTGITERLSIDSSGVEGNDRSEAGAISADGEVVVISSLATNLVSGDSNGFWDAFVRDRTTGLTERISIDSSGAEANSWSVGANISADGTLISFISAASNLVASDTNGFADGFVHDRSSGVTSRVSIDSSGGEADGDCRVVWISADGRAATFSSVATNLVTSDTNGYEDVFVHDDRLASWSNYGSGFPGTNGVPSFTSNANPVIGTTITLNLENSLRQPTAGLLFAGIQRADLHSSWGGDLLVAPILVLPITFSYGIDQFDWAVPADFGLLGIAVDLQALEADPGAAKGVSFTAGLELVIGL